MPETKITREDRQRISSMYESGQSIRKIADAMELTYTSVNRILHQEGALMRKPGGSQALGQKLPTYSRTTPEERAQIVSLHRSGLTVREVVKKTDRSYGTVYNIVKEAQATMAALEAIQEEEEARSMKVERTHQIQDREPMIELWELYCRIFEDVNTRAVQRHMMSWDEFRAVMLDLDVIKYVVRMEDGSARGISVLTNKLKAWPLISPDYFRVHFPDFYEREAIWYCGFVGMEQVQGRRVTHGFRALVCAMLEDIHSNQGMTVMDFCMYNAARKKLPDVTASLLESLYPRTVSEKIDQQEFWAYRFDGTKP